MSDDTDLGHVRAVLARNRAALLALPGATGVGVGAGASPGRYAIVVHAADASTRGPSDVEGIPVHYVTTGRFRPH